MLCNPVKSINTTSNAAWKSEILGTEGPSGSLFTAGCKEIPSVVQFAWPKINKRIG